MQDESVKGEIPARDIHVKGEKEYRVGIDDRDFRDPPPEANFPAKVAYFSVGVFEGVWNLTGGVAVAMFKDLPLLLAKGDHRGCRRRSSPTRTSRPSCGTRSRTTRSRSPPI